MEIGNPAAFLGDADRDDIELRFIDCVEDRSGGEQRDLMLTAATAEEDADAKFFQNRSP